jgi:hypothetical protein
VFINKYHLFSEFLDLTNKLIMNRIIEISINIDATQKVRKNTPIEHNESFEYKLQGITKLNRANSIKAIKTREHAQIFIPFILFQILF